MKKINNYSVQYKIISEQPNQNQNFSFNLSAPPGYKIIKEPNIILYKKINKTRLDSIQCFLEDHNHNPVDFNSETLTFTIQIIKIKYKRFLIYTNQRFA